MDTQTVATVEDLYDVEGKDAFINGRVVAMPPTGLEPGRTGDEQMRNPRYRGGASR